uniref:Heat shock factor-binding protein 1 n=1 Tax=Fundulus heteroclitus TaxID=8078 RepID=A0A3Q2P0V2_FUNHE
MVTHLFQLLAWKQGGKRKSDPRIRRCEVAEMRRANISAGLLQLSSFRLQVQTLLQQMQDKFQTMSDQIIGRIDEMSTRIDDLEKNIADLMTQAGVEEIEAAPEKPKESQGS